MKISELTKLCGYEFFGEDLDVCSIRCFDHANENDIAIIKDLDCIEQTKAKCVLLSPTVVNTNKTILFTCDSIDLASVKLGKLLKEKNPYKEQKQYKRQGHFFVAGNVKIGKGTVIGPNVCIEANTVIGNDCYISSNSYIGAGTILGNNIKVGSGTIIGADSFYHYYDQGLQEFEGLGRVIIKDRVSIGNNAIIQRGTFSDTIIGDRSKIGNLIDIGHDVEIGCDCKVVSQTGIASDVKIQNNVIIYGHVAIANYVCIGENAVIHAKSLVTKNIPQNQHVSGIFAQEHKKELRMQAKLRRI